MPGVHDTSGGWARRALTRLGGLLPSRDPAYSYPRATSARVLAAVFDVVVALRLLWPGDVILDPVDNPNFALVARHFHGDLALGLLLLACGAVMVAALYTDGVDRVAGWATWLSLLTWLLVAVDLLLVNRTQMGPLAYLLAVALNAYAYYHLLEWREQQRRDTRGGAA